jgi:flagellar hook-associated protein 3 FlgL
MRISTTMLYDRALSALNRQHTEMLKTQQQLATGKRLLSAEADPVAAARAIETRQALAANEQYGHNRQQAAAKLGLVEGALANVGSLIQGVRLIAVSAGNPALSDKDRANLAVDLRSHFDELLGIANMKDESGHYLFSGYRVWSQPFAPVAGGVVYSGDQGTRFIQVSDTREIAVSAPGSEVFERIRTGNGTFFAAADGANSGGGIISAGSVVDAGALTGHSYAITFTAAGGNITYDVTNTTTGTVVSGGNPYVDGNAITFGGMRVEISGSPANGDQFTIRPSTSQSVFTTIEELTVLLTQPAGTGGAQLANGINAALQNLDQALDNVLGVRSSVGGRLKELDTLDATGEALRTQHQQTLSALQDVDLAQAISQLAQQQLYLEAAQRSFLKVTGLTLFNYL